MIGKFFNWMCDHLTLTVAAIWVVSAVFCFYVNRVKSDSVKRECRHQHSNCVIYDGPRKCERCGKSEDKCTWMTYCYYCDRRMCDTCCDSICINQHPGSLELLIDEE